MPNGDDLTHLVEDVNARDAPALDHVVEGLLGDGRMLDAISGFAAGIGLGARSGRSMGMDAAEVQIDPTGAKAFVSLLGSHPAFTEGRRLDVAIPIVGPADDDPALFDVRRDAADLLTLGVLAVGALGLTPEDWIDGLIHVAMGPDAFSTVLRQVLIGKPLPDPEGWGVVPAWIVRIMEEIDRRTCVLGLEHALNDVGRAAQGIVPVAYATGIAALSPSAGCDGTIVTIQGSGFGPSQPRDVDVYFSTRAGSCAQATVTSWSDTAIVVTAPAGVGPGCVGFVRRGSGGSGNLTEATSTLAGEMERCLGMAGSAAAYKLRHVSLLGAITCPSCLPNKANFFGGGLASIGHFAANGGSDVAVEPGDTVTLSWGTTNASTLSLTRTSMAGPCIPPPPPLPAAASFSMGAFMGSTPATATYRLTASNGCGTVTRSVTVRLQKTPKLAVSAIEVVQVIQRANNSVRLVQGKATAVRVFVDSGLTGGFDYGKGPDVMPNVVGRATAFPVGGGQGFDLGAAWAPGSVDARPAATMNRNVQSHSLNFDLPANLAAGTVKIEVRVVVKGHENDVGGPFVGFGATTVAFQTQPTQQVLPFLVADPLLGLPAPTLAQFFTSLGGAIVRYGIADTGFIVNPPQAFSTVIGTNIRPLTSSIGWSLTLLDLATM